VSLCVWKVYVSVEINVCVGMYVRVMCRCVLMYY